MISNKKIFFIFQDISITGAPIIFNNYLNLALKNECLEIKIFSRYKSKDHLEISDIDVLHNHLPKNIIQSIIFKCYDLLYFAYYLWKYKPNVIFSNSYINTIPILIGCFFDIKTIVLIHENEGAHINFKSLRNFVIKKANTIIVVSKASLNFCINQKIDQSKIFLVNNGLDLSRIVIKNPSENKIRITLGAIANWSKFKRLDLVIEFYRKLQKEKSCNFSLRIGGSFYFAYKDEFEKIVYNNPDVIFEGLVYDNAKFYNNLDGYIYFSENESYPTVLMETLYFQIPVFSLSQSTAAIEVLGDSIICENSLDKLVHSCNNFYRYNFIEKFQLWHKLCLQQLEKNDIIKSWNKIYSLIQ